MPTHHTVSKEDPVHGGITCGDVTGHNCQWSDGKRYILLEAPAFRMHIEAEHVDGIIAVLTALQKADSEHPQPPAHATKLR